MLKIPLAIAFFLISFLGYYQVFAVESTFSDSNLNVDVKHPSAVTPSSKFTLSTVLTAKNPDIANITMSLEVPANFKIIDEQALFIESLEQDSSVGHTFTLLAEEDATEGGEL